MAKDIVILDKHKKSAMQRISNYINGLIERDTKKADKFMYWLEDYIKFLENEDGFNPSKLKKYKRGELLKVHLGYNIGSEEGGLHYVVVLDKNNSLNSPVITVIPLTSVKKHKDIKNLKPYEVYIGNELCNNIISKLNKEMQKIQEILDKFETEPIELENIKERADICASNYRKLQEFEKEIYKMHLGSIALISQITTISKIRIYNPKNTNDILSKIKISDSSLDMIDRAICNFYTNIQNKDE